MKKTVDAVFVVLACSAALFAVRVMAETHYASIETDAIRLGEQFGLIVGEVDENVRQVLGLQRAEGMVVFEVLGGTPAELAGIKVGSIVKEIDKIEVRTLSDFGLALRSALKTENFTVATYEPADAESQGVSGGINFHFVRIDKA